MYMLLPRVPKIQSFSLYGHAAFFELEAILWQLH